MPVGIVIDPIISDDRLGHAQRLGGAELVAQVAPGDDAEAVLVMAPGERVALAVAPAGEQRRETVMDPLGQFRDEGAEVI